MSEAASAPAGYEVDEADLVDDAAGIVAAWRASLGNVEGRAAKLEWFYRSAPGGALLQVLRAGPGREIVGTAGVGWRSLRSDGLALRGGLLADMTVLAAHRLLGPALQLQRAACERALAEGELVYGFPNANAVPVVKRLGYSRVGEMMVHVRALRHAPYLRRWLPAPLATLAGSVLDRALRLRDTVRALLSGPLLAEWRDTPADGAHPRRPVPPGTLESERDSASLGWRFTLSPLASFRFLYLRERAGAPPAAWLVCHRAGDDMRIVDLGFDRDAAGLRALALLAHTARGEGCKALTIECCLPEGELAVLATAGFRPRQGRPIYVRWKEAPGAPTTVRMTAFDEDE